MVRKSVFSRRLMMIGLLGLPLAALAVVFVLWSWFDCANAGQLAEADAKATACLLEEHTLRSLSAIDGALLQAGDLVAEVGLDGMRTETGWRRLRSLARPLPPTAAIFVYAPAGDTVASTASYPAPAFNASEREYFQALLEGYEGLFIGKSLAGKTGQVFFPLARSIRDPDGKVSAVVQVGVADDFLKHLFRGSEWAGGKAFGLYSLPEGRMVARHPVSEAFRDESIADAPFCALPDERAPDWAGWIGTGGHRRLVSARRVKGMPLMVTVSIPRDLVFAAAQRRMLWHGFSLAVATLAWLVLGFLWIRAETALKKTSQLANGALQALPAHIAVVDPRGRIVAVNEAWMEFARQNDAGSSPAVTVGANYLEVCRRASSLQDADAIRALEGIRGVIAGASGNFTMEYACHSPVEQRWFSMQVVPFGAGGREGAVITHLNITVRKRGDERLRAAMAELARSNKELEQFASVSSHDLQEPLRMITAFAGLLRERYQDKLDGQANEYLALTLEGATRMQVLIKDLLDYSRIGAKPKSPATLRVQDALDEARVNLKTVIESSGARITQDALPTVKADLVQLAQVFQNLIGNAIKYRAPQVVPEIHVGAEALPGEWRFSVRDNGIGFEPQYADRIFQIFQRLHTRDEYEGTGVGLAICKKIVEVHGGRIWVESAPGKGSTFFFTLPA